MPVSYIFMGIKHCGKTTIGREFSKLTGLDFIDLDMEIENEYSEERPLNFREIYRLEGKEKFRELELSALERIYKETRDETVLSLGGGTIENIKAVEILKKSGISVYLKEAENILYNRILSSGIPPFLEGGDPEVLFHKLYIKRDRLYGKFADLTVELNGRNPSEAAQKVNRSIKSYLRRE